MRISDWSSYVCSSDLILDQISSPQALCVLGQGGCFLVGLFIALPLPRLDLPPGNAHEHRRLPIVAVNRTEKTQHRSPKSSRSGQIGRESRRERVWQDVWISVVSVYLKKKKQHQ